MLDFNMGEMMVVAVVALLVIGPKDLPKAMRFVGQWVGKARGVARQFRSGFDAMVREAELAEMEKKWADENARIMREHPPEPAMLTAPAATESANEDQPAETVAKPDIRPEPYAGTTEPAPIPSIDSPGADQKAAS
ncbi:Sec-independent protein translocase protein TatB [Sphingomonas sp. 37zxx]|uniref:Sec-independent protein translocase protein TatB n=1 Tax=Sphingomonas sp. 37zxx TaxID=1550073 RepID=UPI0009DE5F81|nr:Sec-independent protein translocase protein TatB [Sphingomonas sp. 37zxx]